MFNICQIGKRFFSKSTPLVNCNIQNYAPKGGKTILTKVVNIQNVHLPLW